MSIKPFSWADRPALIESLFPVQKISVEAFKEQMAGAGKTLTALGSYWKGRKPLILNKACILGALLPATENSLKDLEIFELLMGMDRESLRFRLQEKNDKTSKTFLAQEQCVSDNAPYLSWVKTAARPEECGDDLFSHIWPQVNEHLGTNANTFPELVEQMGIARFGHRPRVADVFCGSGQIPFEAARLGCDVYASDLNPIACMLTWGAFNIVGAPSEKRETLKLAQQKLAAKVQAEIDALGVELAEDGWRAKVYLYCVEALCPETGWTVPLIPSLIISKGYKVIAKLIPIAAKKRYDIKIIYVKTNAELDAAKIGTVQGGEMVHSPDGVTYYRTKISTLRGDYKDGKENKNRLRMWEKSDFLPRPDDIYQERLYCIQWMRKKGKSKKDEYLFRSVSAKDLVREQKVIDYVGTHLADWQKKGWIPDMVIEAGDKTDEPIRTRGWTYWHQLFNPRHLLSLGLIKKHLNSSDQYVALAAILDFSSKLSRWTTSGARIAKDGSEQQIGGASNNTSNVYYNQALNTLFNWGCRSLIDLFTVLDKPIKSKPINSITKVYCLNANEVSDEQDIFITDPPYGDAVKYEEITEFFIAWLRKNPPAEFSHWTWDSRRVLAIKGEDEGFRQGMIAAYTKMTQAMPDNGIQVCMFTHQSGAIWSDMTNIIWASGLQVTAAWYVVTESDSAIRQGANVTGTIMLVLRKRSKKLETFRDDLGWEIEAAVKQQIESLTGLDHSVREQNSEGVYNAADLQMAGYAAALRVLTTYAVIDGKEMEVEARAPRQKGIKSFVDEMIDFAVQTAVQFLIPGGFSKEEWHKLAPIERYYLKMVDMESQGSKTLDNYQNFAKAFRIQHFDALMASSKANSARVLTSAEFLSGQMAGGAELANTPLRAMLYAMWELQKNIEVDDVLLHLMDNCNNCKGGFLANKPLLITIAGYLANKRTALEPKNIYEPEESSARVLTEALRNQRLG